MRSYQRLGLREGRYEPQDPESKEGPRWSCIEPGLLCWPFGLRACKSGIALGELKAQSPDEEYAQHQPPDLFRVIETSRI